VLVRRALQRCELVVLQEAFAGTATAAYADVLLPASTWGEKEGTVTNSERCISRVRAAVAPPGQARDDWRIAVDFARALQPLLRPGIPDLFPYPDVEAVWNEHRQTTRGRDLDITGLSYALLDTQGPQQWPYPAGASAGRARLYEDGRFATDDGRARFVAAPYRPPAEVRDARHPFALNTGRLRDQWHGMSRSGSVPRLFGHEGRPVLRMNPHDLPRRGLAGGDLVELRSRRGATVLPLVADERVAQTQAFVAMHWGSEFVSGRAADGSALAGVNAITHGAFCPDSKQPELKHASVAVTRLNLPWRLSAAAWLDAAALTAVRDALRARMARFEYADCVPVAGADGRTGLRFEAAAAQPIDAALVDEFAALLGLQGASVLRYADPRRGRRRLLQVDGQGAAARIQGLLLVGELPLADWLGDLWRDQAPVAEHRRALLAPEPVAPQGLVPRGRQVCNCLDVSESRIRACLPRCPGDARQRLSALQGELKCGTQCGSCLPELRQLVQQVPAAMQTLVT
jgi:assimilatory nitrate reductase catalytic subunit